LHYDGVAVEVSIRDVAGKVNLNAARGDLLASILAGSGLAERDNAALADAILDWRDADHERRANGAEDSDYANAGAGYGARDGPFATVDELRYVRGMTDTVYRRIAPLLTVYGNHRRVFAAAAAPEVLHALLGPEDSRVDAYIQSREADEAGAARALAGLDRRFVQISGEGIYAVTATAKVGDVSATAAAVLQDPRENGAPPDVLVWRTDRGAADEL
jgi:general secretion pathway protein K